MKEKELSELSDQELLKKQKDLLIFKRFYLILTVLCLPVVVYSIMKKGLTASAVIPFFIGVWLLARQKEDKLIAAEIKSRNLS